MTTRSPFKYRPVKCACSRGSGPSFGWPGLFRGSARLPWYETPGPIFVEKITFPPTAGQTSPFCVVMCVLARFSQSPVHPAAYRSRSVSNATFVPFPNLMLIDLYAIAGGIFSFALAGGSDRLDVRNGP